MAFYISHRQTSFWDFSGLAGISRVHFLKKQEQSFVSPECDDFHVVSEHPVLIDYQDAWTSVYLASASSHPESTLEHLAANVASLVGPWRSSSNYFNDLMDPLDLLRSGSGLLAQAPKAVAVSLRDVLDRAGIRHTALPSRPPRRPMQALIAGPNFVVARQFRTESGPNNSFKPMPLRGTA